MRPQNLFAICLLTLSLVGCAYHVGPVGGVAAGSQSIQIIPFSNDTLEPRLTDAVTTELRKRLQQDGTFKLDTHGNGDLILTGVITKYDRSEVSFDPLDTLTLRDTRINITAHVTATNRSTGQVVLDKFVDAHTMARVGADLPSAERQALPLLAEDLAKKVISLLAEGSW